MKTKFNNPLAQAMVDTFLATIDFSELSLKQKIMLIRGQAGALTEVVYKFNVCEDVANIVATPPAKGAKPEDKARYEIALELNALNQTISGDNLSQIIFINEKYFPAQGLTADELTTMQAELILVLTSLQTEEAEESVSCSAAVKESDSVCAPNGSPQEFIEQLDAANRAYSNAANIEAQALSFGQQFKDFVQCVWKRSLNDVYLPTKLLPVVDANGVVQVWDKPTWQRMMDKFYAKYPTSNVAAAATFI